MTACDFDRSTVQQVTVIRLGTEFQTIYEGQLPLLGEIQDLAQRCEPARLVVDVSAVEYFGSAFIAFLISIGQSIQTRDGGKFAVSAPTAFGQMAFSSTKAHEIFAIFQSTEEAISSLAPEQ